MINLPKEYKDEMKNILGKDYDAFIDSYKNPSYKGLRINTLKINSIDSLPFDLTPVDWCETGFYYEDKDQPGKHPYHEMGLYYIQEPSAMSAVEELDVKEGDRVLDLCAAPGGKSTQIAMKLNGTGILVSNEIIPSRAKILSQNIERMGIRNALVINEEPKDVAKHFKGFFDKILIDAPCSGEGMFRKNEEAISEWSMDNVLMCADRQKDILSYAVKCLKENGQMVFSTCTFSKQENESVVQDFLEKHPEFHLVKSKFEFEKGLDKDGLCQRVYPHKVKGEGHFFAILKRGEDTPNDNTNDIKKLPKQDPDFEKFVKQYLNIKLSYNLVFGDNLYLSPITKLDGIKVVRAGLHLGELKKNRFEPSHSLALALKREDFKNIINLEATSPLCEKYMQGETIPTTCVGWGVVCVDGHPLGLFKGDGSIAKNHYPKGLRR
jgi:NOL1/NOP2/sun family putative RNA methylase